MGQVRVEAASASVEGAVKDRDTIRGLSILVNNCAVQVSGLLAVLDVGGEPFEQANVAQKACDLAGVALTEAEPTLRKLARKPRGK